MANTIQVIPMRQYFNPATGATASIYGAHPGEAYIVRTNAYTWRLVDSQGSTTVGLGCMPAKTLQEATERAERVAALRGATILPPQV